MKSSFTAVRRSATLHASLLVAAVFGLGSCATDIAGSATTVVAVSPTAFATIPPLVTTIPEVTTTLPIGAVGVEQTYTVRPNDSPIAVANLYGITVAELLAWNGLVASSQFPFPGQTLKIPPTAMVLNPVVPVAPDVSAAPSQPGCDPRPAGTYKVERGDSLYSIRTKFCVSEGALLSANGWPSNDVTIVPGQVINIPPANQ
jgi:LysM repeat protein